MNAGNERLRRQLDFIIEVDKLKHVLRRSRLIGSSRYENDAEHTWHLAMMAVLLTEHASDRGLDLLKVVKMLLIHDIVEIDAGDTFAYDEKGYEDKLEREERAAQRIFGLLPEDQRAELLALWKEFEERETSEAKYAAALDRLQPLLLNYRNEGQSWKENRITSDKVLKRNQTIEEGSAELWSYAKALIASAVDKGYLQPGPDGQPEGSIHK